MMRAEATLPEALWVGDHLALDFLNTIAAPSGALVDWLRDDAALVDWLVGAFVLPGPVGARLLRKKDRSQRDEVAREARQLREWLRAIVERMSIDPARSFAAQELAGLNSLLARYPAHLHVAPVAGGVALTSERPWSDTGELLAPIAEAIAELVANGDFALIRKCENPPCTLWFYDRTKGHKRRWCSQSMCGNRAKVAAFRERLKRKE